MINPFFFLGIIPSLLSGLVAIFTDKKEGPATLRRFTYTVIAPAIAFSPLTERGFNYVIVALGATYFVLMTFLEMLALSFRRKHVRGTKILSLSQFEEKLIDDLGEDDYFKGFIPVGDNQIMMPMGLEGKSMLIVGQSRSGKSVCIKQMIKSLQNFDRGIGYGSIVLDQSDLYSSCADKNSLLLDPYDQRSVRLNIFKDIPDDPNSTALRLAADILFPLPQKGEQFWAQAEQNCFIATFKYIHRNYQTPDNVTLYRFLSNNADLVDWISTLASDPEVKPWIAPSFGSVIRGENPDKTQNSIFNGFMNKCFIFRIPVFAQHGDWSLLQFIDHLTRGGNQTLFIRMRQEQIRDVVPFYQTILQIALNRVIGMSKGEHPRLFFFFDEVPAWVTTQAFAKQVLSALSQAQKNGLSFYFAAQDISQLNEAFGRNGRATLFTNCSSHLILRVSDPETTEYYSKAIGEADLRETELSFSAGMSAGGRDDLIPSGGVQSRTNKRVERAVIPSEIAGLQSLTGYLKMGPFWTKIDFRKDNNDSDVRFYNAGAATQEKIDADLKLPSLTSEEKIRE